MHALLRHPPLPGHGEQMAAAAGLQFLAVNGWQADLDVPRAAAITIEGLASGQLTPADAASWLEVRLSPDPASPDRATIHASPAAARIPGTADHARPGGRRPAPPVPAPAPAPSSSASARRTSPPASAPRPPGYALHRPRPQLGRSAPGRKPARRGQPRGPEHILLGLTGEQ